MVNPLLQPGIKGLMATKANSRPSQTSEMFQIFKHSANSLLASEANLEFCQTSKMEFFANIVKN